MSDIYEINRNLYRDDRTFWFDDWKFHRPIFFTGYLNEYYSYNIDKVKKNNTHFFENLHKKVFKKIKKKSLDYVWQKKVRGTKKYTHI